MSLTMLVPFLALAVIGLELSLVAHVAALLRRPQPLGEATWFLHLGAMVVWVPAFFSGSALRRDFRQKAVWGEALRGCPRWMGKMTAFWMLYAAVTLVITQPGGHGNHTPPHVFQGFSAGWILFYWGSTAALYSAIVVARRHPAEAT